MSQPTLLHSPLPRPASISFASFPIRLSPSSSPPPRGRLYCASCALKALITPLEYPHVYIPLLPTHLMEVDSVATLLLDSCTPYLIGLESQLLHSIGSTPTNAVIADLDCGAVSRAPGTEWFDPRAPPFLALCRVGGADIRNQLSVGDLLRIWRVLFAFTGWSSRRTLVSGSKLAEGVRSGREGAIERKWRIRETGWRRR